MTFTDELIVLNRQKDLNRYRKRIKYYARIQRLFIDDFAISRYSEKGIKILYHLLKLRDDLGTSTLFSCQYSPDEWGKQLSDENECYGKLDGIQKRLTIVICPCCPLKLAICKSPHENSFSYVFQRDVIEELDTFFDCK